MIFDYSKFKKNISKIPISEEDIAEQDEWALRLGEDYLESNESKRREIREMFVDPDAQWYLVLLIDRLCKRPWAASRDWLKAGLAVLSIQDRRVDPRDFITRAENLFSHAKKEGINPYQAFCEIADISSHDREYFEQSTAELLRMVANKNRTSDT